MAQFGQTREGAYLVRAWDWLRWSYTQAIPKHIQALRVLSRRDIRG